MEHYSGLKAAGMDNRRIWKLAEELNVFQIVLLMAEIDPTEFESDNFDRWDIEVKMETTALKVVVQHAVIAEKIQANIEKYEGNYENEINWNSTRIDIRSFTNWLNAKNFGSCFFTDNWLDIPGYADAEGPFYAPKLAAAVDGWRAVTTNPELLKNKTPKQALDKWLREHALDYGLTLESGDPNKSGISEISKIANWKPEGGASPTTTSVKAEIKSSLRVGAGGRQLRGRLSTPSRSAAIILPTIDDDIPF